MTRIIAVANPKGGVGKTTTAINLAASLAIAEKRVLIIDVDPAGAVGPGLGFSREDIEYGIYEMYAGSADWPELICPSNTLGMDIIFSNIFTSDQEFRLGEMAKNRIRLKRQMDSLIASRSQQYDYILIDTPPSLNDLTVGALLAANSVVVPLQCGQFAINAVERLMELVARIARSANPGLVVEGILLNFHERGTRIGARSTYRAERLFPEHLFQTIIPKNVTVGLSAFEAKPVALVDICSTGARGFLALAEEMMARYPDPEIYEPPVELSELAADAPEAVLQP